MNQNAAGGGDAVVAGRWYSDCRMLSTCCLLDVRSKEGRYYHRRSFSKFSQEEVVVQGPDPPSTSLSSTPQNSTTAPISVAAANNSLSMLSEAPQQAQPQAGDNVEQKAQQNPNDRLLMDLHEAHELFHQIYTEAKALLRNNENSTSSEEVVAMADYFMILVNSLDLEKSLAMIQSLQTARSHETQEDGKKKKCKNNEEGDREEEVDEKLHQAVKSMSQLHHVFLTMVESAVPPSPPVLSTEKDKQSKKDAEDPLFNKEIYSARTVGRALQLSRRAVELGMPIHRPLYQRLATGTVLTSSPSTPSWMLKPSLPPADNASEPESNEPSNKESPSLILPGHHQLIKGLETSRLVLELLGIYHHARSALKIPGDQLHQLAIELWVDPLLLLLKQKQWNEAMALLRAWGVKFGKGEKIDLLGLLGERHTLDALEIAKGWLEGSTELHSKDVQEDPHVRELTNLLEVAVAEILRGKKQREEKLSHLLWQLSLHEDDDSDNFDEESDSDSDFEDEFEYDNDGDDELETGATTPTPDFSTVADFASSTAVRAKSDPQLEIKWHDGATVTFSFRAGDEITSTPEIVQGKKVPESTIMKGLSNDVARQMIYLRNADWSLPDIVPTLEEWNKGNQLRFTPEFERYLGRIMEESREEDGN